MNRMVAYAGDPAAYWVTRHRCFEGDKPTDLADALGRRLGTSDALAQFVTKARDGNI